jgi:hypothetical protein
MNEQLANQIVNKLPEIISALAFGIVAIIVVYGVFIKKDD